MNPTRPSASDNAYLTARGYTEIEFGLAYDRDAWALPTLLKWTLHPRIELGFITPGLIQSDDSEIAFGLNDDAQEWIFQIGFTSLLFKISR